ncbi:MAG: hypothetical protein ACPGRE_09440 [Flavobacteriaceae bacterium]
MTEYIKLIWDFHGEDALKTAEHHVIHLKEFAQIEGLPYYESKTEEINDNHYIAYISVERPHMIPFRDALKPHRGLKVSH